MFSLRHMLERNGRRRASCVLNPHGAGMLLWDLGIALLMAYTAFVVPFQAAFAHELTPTELAVDLCVTAYFAADLCLHLFCLPFFDFDRGCWVTDHALIACHYLHSWFLLDLIACVPFEQLLAVAPSGRGQTAVLSLRLVRMSRIYRLARLLRIARVGRIWRRWQSHAGVSYASRQLMIFCAILIVLVHWVCCSWGMVPALWDLRETWVDGAAVVSSNPSELYVHALYLSWTGLIAGSMPAMNHVERWMAIFTLVLGGSLYAFMMAQVCSVISKGDLTLREHQQDIDEVNRFVHKFEFPAGLRLRLRGYFRHCEGLRRAQKFRELVRKMSPGLQGEVSTVLFQRNFGQVRCFCAADKAERRHFGHMLALVLIPQVFCPHEQVVSRGSALHSMHIIEHGLALQSLPATGRLGRMLRPGHSFGQDMIMYGCLVRDYAVGCLTFLDVYTLRKSDLEEILRSNEFPQTRFLIRKAALGFALDRTFKKLAASLKDSFDLQHKSALACEPPPQPVDHKQQHSCAALPIMPTSSQLQSQFGATTTSIRSHYESLTAAVPAATPGQVAASLGAINSKLERVLRTLARHEARLPPARVSRGMRRSTAEMGMEMRNESFVGRRQSGL